MIEQIFTMKSWMMTWHKKMTRKFNGHYLQFAGLLLGTASLEGIPGDPGKVVQPRLVMYALRDRRSAKTACAYSFRSSGTCKSQSESWGDGWTNIDCSSNLLRTRVQCLRCAKDHQHCTQKDWNRVIFYAESRFCLRSPDGGVGMEDAAICVPCTFSWRGVLANGSVMDWGGIHLNSRTELVLVNRSSLTSVKYVREVLELHVLIFARNTEDKFIFMHNNTGLYLAQYVKNYLWPGEIQFMVWPSRSTDTNPIEHVWDMLIRLVNICDSQDLINIRGS